MKSWRCVSPQLDSLKGGEEKGGAKAAGLSLISAWHRVPVAGMATPAGAAACTGGIVCTALHAVSSLGFPSEQTGPPRVPSARTQCNLLNGWESLLQITLSSWYKILS